MSTCKIDSYGMCIAIDCAKHRFILKEEAIKHDKEKIRLELLPTEALEEVAKVLTHGAAKYGDYNWTKGMAWSRLSAALMRHLFAWFRGERLDAESGISHLAHANCCLLFLLTYELKGLGTDDRPKIGMKND